MRVGEFHPFKDGAEILVLHAAIVPDFSPLLDDRIEYCWILGHMPRRTGDWWNTTVPVDDQGKSITAQVRMISYDLQLPTARFLEHIEQFADSGLMLMQSRKSMPPTLMAGVQDIHRFRTVLIQNEVTLVIQLPHAIETSVVSSYRRGYLESRIPLLGDTQ